MLSNNKRLDLLLANADDYKNVHCNRNPKVFRRRDEEALHIIRRSCLQEMQPYFYNITSTAAAFKVFEKYEHFQKDTYAKFSLLLRAIEKEDWWGPAMDAYHRSFPEAFHCSIQKDGSTALHVAIGLRRADIAGRLTKIMKAHGDECFKIKTRNGSSPITLAAEANYLELVKDMVEASSSLLQIQNEQGNTPLIISAINGHQEMFSYLYSVTIREIERLDIGDIANIITDALRVDLYDVALDLLKKFPESATIRDAYEASVFSVLAGKPSAFPSGNRLGLWQSFIYRWVGGRRHGLIWEALKSVVPGIKHLHDKKVRQENALHILDIICPRLSDMTDYGLAEVGAGEVIHLAATNGIVEFFTQLINSNPRLLSVVDKNGRGLFQIAVMCRQVNIFELISQIDFRNQSTTPLDKWNNNILHCAALWTPTLQMDKVSGAALQMQREIQWFQEVEQVVRPSYREMKNKYGIKPRDLFAQEHKFLLTEGEKWIKEASQACMIVSTLIATVMFAAAFTVPGGNNQNTGLPMFLKLQTFQIFIISDAVSLFSSCTSILIFFTLLTTRYSQPDFLVSLPTKLIFGLFFLFISIAFMMAAFATTLVIALNDEYSWIVIPVIVLAVVPVILYGFLQLPLFIDIVKSTYGRGLFSRKKVQNKSVKII
ncbi:hypothetical protein MKX03_027372 [Papaver bracteatum]|nr:hypothetical protein MKX03_027372 [Papaver bracteatum]